jgi:hypothetical protein
VPGEPTPAGPDVWRFVGALVASRTSAGDIVVSVERVAFWLVFLACLSMWVRGVEVPSGMVSLLNTLIAAIVGHGVLSTVGVVARQAAAPSGDDQALLSHTYTPKH